MLLPTHGTGGLQAGVDLDDKEALAELIGDNAAPYPVSASVNKCTS